MNRHIFRDFLVFARQEFFHLFQLIIQTSRKNKPPHGLDESDGFALDIMVFLMRMENSVGIFFVAAVIAEQKIEEIFPAFLSRDGRQRVVRRVRLRDDAYALVRIVQPFPEHLFREGDDCPFILSLQQNDTVVPIGKTRLHARVGRDEFERRRSLEHREGVLSALKMFVRQNTAADDGKGRVGADKVLRRIVHEIEKFQKRLSVQHHGGMFRVDGDPVLIKIRIGRILPKPFLPRQRQGYRAHIAAGTALPDIPDVFAAEHALGITRRDVSELSRLFIVLFGLA